MEDDVRALFTIFGAQFSLSLDHLQEVGFEESMKHALDQAHRRQDVPVDFDLDHAKRFLAVYKPNIQMRLRYKLHGYKGPMFFVQASSQQIPHGWDKLNDKVEVLIVPGNHRSILNRPAVQQIAERLNQILEDINGRYKFHNPD
ncbi:hypothetical protein [Granulicella sp. S190]|uniref:thioesterase domain-containing protein n=1 Tax=Granulicella sp. S190 TaxID=1747226 RepID=UPI00131E349E|nr:hypothetical protein [Granulicella sp. S190]